MFNIQESVVMSSPQSTHVTTNAIKSISETELIPKRTSDYVIFGGQFFLLW